jgi:hypothetical protein
MKQCSIYREMKSILVTVIAVLATVVVLPAYAFAQERPITMNGGTCLGFQTSPTFCKFLMMPDGSMVLNNNWTEGALSVSATENGYTASAVRLLEEIDNNDSDDNSNDDSDNDTEPEDEDSKTYCDVPNPSNPCHDRRDGSEITGLYTCIDGSHEEDWQDCKGGGSEDEENSDEETENCGGEPCTATEKEDSWLDDETEYYEEEPECRENNDGALGNPIPC